MAKKLCQRSALSSCAGLLPDFTKLPNLGCASSGERLAWRAAGEEINALDAPPVQLIHEASWVSQVSNPGEPWNVGRVGLDGHRVGVCRGNYRKSTLFESKTQSARTRKQIDRPGAGADCSAIFGWTRGHLGQECDSWPRVSPGHLGDWVAGILSSDFLRNATVVLSTS